MRFHSQEAPRTDKSRERKGGLLVAGGWGEADTGRECSPGTASSSGAVKTTEARTGLAAARHCEGAECPRTACFKTVNFVIFHLDKNNCSDSKCDRHSK